MKVVVPAQSFEFAFAWRTDQDGDLQLDVFSVDSDRPEYWGMICPHNPKLGFRIFADGRYCGSEDDLESAKRRAQRIAAGDLTRQNAKLEVDV